MTPGLPGLGIVRSALHGKDVVKSMLIGLVASYRGLTVGRGGRDPFERG